MRGIKAGCSHIGATRDQGSLASAIGIAGMGRTIGLVSRLDVAAGDGVQPAGRGINRVVPIGTGIGIGVAGIVLSCAATSGGVMISDLNDKYWQPKYRGAGRMVK